MYKSHKKSVSKQTLVVSLESQKEKKKWGETSTYNSVYARRIFIMLWFSLRYFYI